MKAATINEIKQELNVIAPAKLLDLCIRLAKYKKDNKELLNYLLFEAHDESAYIENVKAEIDEQFIAINLSNLHFVKKSLRKILRTTAKYIRYTGSKQAEVELLLYFCSRLVSSAIPFHKSTALVNLYQSQLKKIGKVIATLHEDLQYDYLKELKKLGEPEVKLGGNFIQLFLKKK
ncbi:MAG: hypothetical protein ABIQ31_21495 [Ferruginibacter sp.]